MTQKQRIEAARALLREVTPLKGDCGRRCGAACCRPDEDGQGGMALFPGEEALYVPAPAWADIAPAAVLPGAPPVPLLTCRGTCPREARPLACRIFPLTPVATGEGVGLELDVRAWPVCPLMPHGMVGLSPAFVRAASEAAALLWADPACRAYITRLTARLAAFRAL